MRHGLELAIVLLLLSSGCAARGRTSPVRFTNLTPGAPVAIDATLVRPAGDGPFPAVIQLHGCAGLELQSYRWAHWLAERGYVSLVVDSYGPRGVKGDCRTGPDEPPITARFDDAMGALRYLQSQTFVRADRIAAIGWSQGGVYAMAVINGPSLERAKRRGVEPPAVGFAAAIGFYPGGCKSLIDERVIRPLLVLIGGADDWTPEAACRQMADEMEMRGADVSIVSTPAPITTSTSRAGADRPRGGGERAQAGSIRRHRLLPGNRRRGCLAAGRSVSRQASREGALTL
jgi:dienelactone hydrolase